MKITELNYSASTAYYVDAEEVYNLISERISVPLGKLDIWIQDMIDLIEPCNLIVNAPHGDFVQEPVYIQRDGVTYFIHHIARIIYMKYVNLS